MTIYTCQFPRFHQDVSSGKRTLVHFPVVDGVPEFEIGDDLAIRPLLMPTIPRVVVVTLEEVSKVSLCDSMAEGLDWSRLNLDIGDHVEARRLYIARWNDANPDVPWESNPPVWRLVFRYLLQPRRPDLLRGV